MNQESNTKNTKNYQNYLTEKQLIYNELTTQIQLQKIIQYFENLYIHTNPNEKKLI